ncbi:MAG: DUF4355 domain-containing protein [Porcipelethomonas sp.]
MTREQVKALFADATDEQISSILNINSADIGKAKKNVSDEELRVLRDKAKKYDDFETSKLSAEEKIKKNLEDSERLKNESAKMLNRANAVSILSAAGVKAEELGGVLDGLVSEDAEKTRSMAEGLAAAFRSRDSAAEARVKDEQMKNMPVPPSGAEGSSRYNFAENIEKAKESGNMALAAALIRRQSAQVQDNNGGK